ncbi:MAG TPA: hypothetical protein VGS13_04840 [Stellaceae bacterium]|nr:hypothetical protein [Stellaceae bacterium]
MDPIDQMHAGIRQTLAFRQTCEVGCPDARAARPTKAVDRLVADRLLLAEDGDRLTAAARESSDVYEELQEAGRTRSDLTAGDRMKGGRLAGDFVRVPRVHLAPVG